MGKWHVQQGSDVKELSEAKLRSKLRNGDLSGMELVRPEGETSWRPLHTLAVFAEEVPHADDPAYAAATRAFSGWAMHVAAFVGVVVFFSSRGDFPFWAAFWAIGLVAHSMKAFPAIRQLALRRVPVAVAPALPTSELEVALSDLERAAVAGLAPDIAGIRESARALRERRTALEVVAAPALRERLEAELAAARQRIATSTDERSRDAHEVESRALDGRLSSLRDAAAEADRLGARERALVHQVEGMRLAALQAAAVDVAAPDLAAEVARLRDEVRASGEIDESLARARRAAHRQAER